MLLNNPLLAQDFPYRPNEVLVDFFDLNSKVLNRSLDGFPTAYKDRMEIDLLHRMGQDLRKEGAHSISIFQLIHEDTHSIFIDKILAQNAGN